MSKVKERVLDFGHWTLDFGLALNPSANEVNNLDTVAFVDGDLLPIGAADDPVV